MSGIEHFYYLMAQSQLKAALDDFQPGHMVFLVGPSGAGKTTLRRAVMQEMFGNPLNWGPGRIPVVETFARLPNAAYFSSRELAKSLVKELRVPSLAWLFTGNSIPKSTEERIHAELAQCASIWDQLKPHAATEGDYWETFGRCLKARGCKYVSLEQVTALLVNRRNTSPAAHTLHLMSLAEEAGVMFIMTGIHTATRLWAIHSELRRRVITVWMPPYSDKRKGDEPHYLCLLKTLSTKYEFSRSDLLCTMANDLLAATGGVFAEIVQLLERAQRHARLEGVPRIHKRHIEGAYYNDEDLATLWRDIEAFELAMEPGDVSKRSTLVEGRWKLGSTGHGEPS
jgi:hypothetical protein